MLLTVAAVCLMAAMAFAAQCAATARKGTPGKRQAPPGSEFCCKVVHDETPLHGLGEIRGEAAGNDERHDASCGGKVN